MKIIFLLLSVTLTLLANERVIKISGCSVDQTVQNIEDIVKKKGLSVFAVIDHQKNAQSVGMSLNESKLIIFGNPKVGTKLMQENIRVALDLPLKILVYKDNNSNVKMAYRKGTWIAKEHTLNINKVENINKGMDNITNKAGQCKQD